MSSAFVLEGISKSYLSRSGSSVQALSNASFEAPEGKITCLIGPTGAGKSTVLRLLSGLDRPEAGRVAVGGRLPGDMIGGVGYLTQEPTLLPWLRLWRNIALPLELRGTPSKEARQRARELMEVLGLSGHEELYPYELSGGMRQRAALGRLLAMEARYWLLDEPFASLDERTRYALESLLLSLVQARGVSVLLVTHSLDEAAMLADRVVILSASPGRVVEYFDLPRTGVERKRLSPEFGALIERMRTGIESILGQ